MDNKKIGKLIAELRNAKGMTQQELGDKVGVGFRAVSKWERGLTLPDIGIINELSNILGITLDELLTGELKKTKKNDNSKPKTKTLIISIITTLIISILTLGIIFTFKNKTYIYNLECIESDKYYVEGKVYFKGKEITIIVNELKFLENKTSETKIQDYEYDIMSNKMLIFGYGYQLSGKYIEQNKTVKKIENDFRINYTGVTHITKEEIINNNIKLVINFIDTNNNYFSEEIELRLIEQN